MYIRMFNLLSSHFRLDQTSFHEVKIGPHIREMTNAGMYSFFV